MELWPRREDRSEDFDDDLGPSSDHRDSPSPPSDSLLRCLSSRFDHGSELSESLRVLVNSVGVVRGDGQFEVLVTLRVRGGSILLKFKISDNKENTLAYVLQSDGELADFRCFMTVCQEDKIGLSASELFNVNVGERPGEEIVAIEWSHVKRHLVVATTNLGIEKINLNLRLSVVPQTAVQVSFHWPSWTQVPN